MAAFILRKFADLLITLFVVSLIVFLLFQFVPGDPVVMLAGLNASPEQIAILKEKLNLDKSLVLQYTYWLSGIIRADFGTSIQYGLSVRELVFDRLIVSTTLAVESFAIIVLISVPAGIIMAYRRKSFIDTLFDHVAILGLSIPHYFIGIIIVWLFGLILHLFVPGQFFHYSQNMQAFFVCLFFPAIAVALPNCSILTKFIRMSIVSQLSSEYVRTAKSKGACGQRILFSHVFRNSLRPVLTITGVIIADVLSGAIVVEQVFGIPGLGRLLVSGIARRDFPLVMTVTIYVSSVVVIINFLMEILIRMVDPRIRTDSETVFLSAGK